MATIDERIDDVYRGYETHNLPSSGAHDVVFSEVRELLKAIAEIDVAGWAFTRWDTTQRITFPISAALTTRALTANTLLCMPLVIGAAGTAARIGVEVTTEVNPSAARLGIYDNSYGKAQPGNLLLDAGTVDTSTAGVKEIVISHVLGPGLYWLVMAVDAAITVRAVSSGILWPMLLGLTNTRPLSGSRAFTFAVLPDDERSATYSFAQNNMPHLWLGG